MHSEIWINSSNPAVVVYALCFWLVSIWKIKGVALNLYITAKKSAYILISNWIVEKNCMLSIEFSWRKNVWKINRTREISFHPISFIHIFSGWFCDNIRSTLFRVKKQTAHPLSFLARILEFVGLSILIIQTFKFPMEQLKGKLKRVCMLFSISTTIETSTSGLLQNGSYLHKNRVLSGVVILVFVVANTYSVALRSVRNDILVTGCTTAKNLSNDIKTNVYTLAWHVTTIIYCTWNWRSKINQIKVSFPVSFVAERKIGFLNISKWRRL